MFVTVRTGSGAGLASTVNSGAANPQETPVGTVTGWETASAARAWAVISAPRY